MCMSKMHGTGTKVHFIHCLFRGQPCIWLPSQLWHYFTIACAFRKYFIAKGFSIRRISIIIDKARFFPDGKSIEFAVNLSVR